MICIRKHDGSTSCTAFCDSCGNGFEWAGNISVTRIERTLRNTHGWTAGKRHLCEKCKTNWKVRAVQNETMALQAKN